MQTYPGIQKFKEDPFMFSIFFKVRYHQLKSSRVKHGEDEYIEEQLCEDGVRGWNGEDKKSPLRNMLEPR